MSRSTPARAPKACLAYAPLLTALWRTALLLTALLLTSCTGSPSFPGTAATPGPGTASQPAGGGPDQPELLRKLDAGLQIPWSVVFLADGTAIISERDSRLIKAIHDGQATTVGEVPGVVPGGEGGLLGLALSPTFADDRLLYAYFTSATDNRIARMRLAQDAGGGLALGSPQVVFSGISKASTHNGGRIRFGPDGFLYVGTGDSQRRQQPQDTNALGGKILRLTPDGKPAPGNPFDGNPVYSYGHRNVQGLAWDSAGRLWASEFGPDVDDELNLIQPGGNYGWPEVTGAPGRPGFLDAKVVWPSTADASPSGLEIIDGIAYAGALRGQRLWAVPLEGGSAGTPVAYFTGEYGRLRDVARAPDGTMWVLSNNRNPDFALVLRP
ncbi:PQQ-dependent sugar dehydrogenase [Arthrobacter cavernae]|uniref:PQQ-dependent sugar dehydrogenase n=1 Tax=Arthrobacter cavernae TaxID=2817681 RepID=A0A939KHV9_9MICC|nr:PQQ-dependent sugar dehydrogenase [Arthrobacter cavernae]MBO1266997.1 PQQ-dependent sugar dehydrogenase [Arthrobacter cavernae]